MLPEACAAKHSTISPTVCRRSVSWDINSNGEKGRTSAKAQERALIVFTFDSHSREHKLMIF